MAHRDRPSIPARNNRALSGNSPQAIRRRDQCAGAQTNSTASRAVTPLIARLKL